MLWKPFLMAACLAVSPARAQMGASDLPDLSGLAGAIEQSVKTPPPAPPKGMLYQSGLTVPSVHPGAAATEIARQMRVSVEAKTGPNPAMQKLEAIMPGLITGLEAQMVKQGFAKRDLGVATGLFFVSNWETATKRHLSDPAENAVVRAVSATAASQWKARFTALSPAAKERTYETLLASTALLSVFAQSFDQAGKTQEAAGIRQTAGALFQKVVGTPPSEVSISAAGRITRAESAGPVKNAPKQDGGVKPSQIAGVYAQPISQVGVGGFVYQTFDALIALKDGTYCEDFDAAPSEFDAAASRQKFPRHWGHWRFNAAAGGGHWHGAARHIQVQNRSGEWKTADWIGPLSGGGPGQSLSGTYSAIGGGGNTAFGGDMSIAYQSTYTFLPGRRFRSGSSASVSSSSVAGGSDRRASGTYTLEEYAITLRFADGTTQRWSYAHTTDPLDDLLYLRGTVYTKDDKPKDDKPAN